MRKAIVSEFNGSPAMLDAYRTATPAHLKQEAQSHEGACESEEAANFDWRFASAFPIAEIDGPRLQGRPCSWHDWMEIEIHQLNEDGSCGKYDNILDGSLLEEPIILHIGTDGHGHIWDGWHRTGSSVIIGRTTIPALVGILKKDHPEFITITED